MKILNFKLINNKPFYNNKELNIRQNSQGYSYVRINKKEYRLHRLIALRYIENKFNYPIVGHYDNNKKNNQITNLYWTSYKNNSKKAFLENNSMKNFHKFKNKPFYSKCPNGNIKKHNTIRECANYLNRDVAAVHRCLNGEWKKCNKHLLNYEIKNLN